MLQVPAGSATSGSPDLGAGLRPGGNKARCPNRQGNRPKIAYRHPMSAPPIQWSHVHGRHRKHPRIPSNPLVEARPPDLSLRSDPAHNQHGHNPRLRAGDH